MKIDYGKINWDAKTNWEFCGTKENLRMVWDRCWECLGVRVPIEEFAYGSPRRGLAFAKGDVVTYSSPNEVPRLATVIDPCNRSTGYFYIRFASGENLPIHPSNVPNYIVIADIPDELVALARAEAGKPLDFSKCPLKKPACAEA